MSNKDNLDGQEPDKKVRTLSFDASNSDSLLLNFPSLTKMGSAVSLSSGKQNEEHLESKTKVFGKFLSGFKRFQENYLHKGGLFDTLRNGQSPKTLVVGCCDSRADPALLTGCDPGDLFVVRNVANLIPPYQPDSNLHGVSAALEFAVKALKVEFIIVLGHTQCGGIGKLMENELEDSSEFLGPWMSIAKAPKERTLKYYGNQDKSIQLRACELASIVNSLENLMTFPWVRDRCEQGYLSLCGWYFDFQSGDILSYNAETFVFERLNSLKEENNES